MLFFRLILRSLWFLMLWIIILHLGDVGSHGRDPCRHHCRCHQEYFLVDQLKV